MDGSPQLWQAVEMELNSPVKMARRIAGGDVAHTFIVHLLNGQRVFCKSHPRPVQGMFQAEAQGLDLLRVPNGPRIPNIVGFRDAPDDVSFLLLEVLEQGVTDASAQIRTGESLAALHGAPNQTQFGLRTTNFIGTIEQENGWMEQWPKFFVERRLWPQIQRAQYSLGRSLMRTLDRVVERAMDELKTDEPACRVHGDLWSGNRLIDAQGRPCLIDPAAFYGNREVDLAMMQLFGGFEAGCIDAYQQLLPLAPGASRRRDFYQLYYLLVHVNLHGASWAGQVAQVAWRIS